MSPDLNVSNFQNHIQARGIDFLDFGCSSGGSLKFGESKLGGTRGLGIDISPSKVEAARDAGYDAAVLDIKTLPDEKLVRFVIMSHFLEHVPDANDVYAFIEKACCVATEFVYVQQPFFDADASLFQQGLKLYWSDWTGHPNRMTSLDMWTHIRTLRAKGVPLDYAIFYTGRIHSSSDPTIHPLTSPRDQHEYDPEKHPPKPENQSLGIPVFRELRCFIHLAPGPMAVPAPILKEGVCVSASTPLPGLAPLDRRRQSVSDNGHSAF
jgi:SAM-dependent methyltransferase